MRRAVLLLAVAVSLLGAGAARAASVPSLVPELLHPHLLTEVGEPVPTAPVFRSGFLAPERHGYRVRVFTYGSAVLVEVLRRGRQSFALSGYIGRGVAAPRRLQASFGELGRVSMRFRPGRGGPESICHDGARLTRRPGLYVGRFTFRGEGGYLDEDLRRAKGAIVEPTGSCPRRHPSSAQVKRELKTLFEPVSGLLARSREGVATTTFLALARGRRAAFLASREETHGKVAIIRIAAARHKGGFHADEAVTAGSFAAPAPFHGVGLYRAAADGTSSWSGDLTVNFPGAPRYPLTGTAFEALIEIPF